jgi:hypothetical protein
MGRWPRERVFLVAFLALHTTLMIVVLGIVFGWWTGGSDDDPAPAAISQANLDEGPGVDTPTSVPQGSLFLITSTPVPSPTATATPVPPTDTPAPTSTPTAKPGGQPSATAAPETEQANFSGRWRVTDTVTDGENTGQQYTFDIFLAQDGNRISGGNDGIRLTGTVTGDTATIDYVQPAFNYTGTFVWKMADPDRATGKFTSSYPNSGDSVITRPG